MVTKEYYNRIGCICLGVYRFERVLEDREEEAIIGGCTTWAPVRRQKGWRLASPDKYHSFHFLKEKMLLYKR